MIVKCLPGPQGNNAVQVSVRYSKGYGVLATAYPAECRSGCARVALAIGYAPTITFGYAPTITLAAIKRNNARFVFVLEAQIKADIDSRTGQGWDLVLECCKANGLTPLEQESPCEAR